MKGSDISSTTPPECPPSATPPRNTFALTGRSVALDPQRHAIRPDLADVRLADRVFAPHYAKPMAMIANRETPLLAAPLGDSLALLAAGDVFDVLEIASKLSWGQRRGDGLVGYVANEALDVAA